MQQRTPDKTKQNNTQKALQIKAGRVLSRDNEMSYARSSAGQSGGFLNRRLSDVTPGSNIASDSLQNARSAKRTIQNERQPESAPGKSPQLGNLGQPDDACPSETAKNWPGLCSVIKAWPQLPEAVRVGILAMVKASVTK